MTGVLKSFDIDPGNYADDVKQISASTIEKYGLEEWKRVLMTNEIHGHLGIYSTIGAKMGVRAKELFQEMGIEVQHNDIAALSYAGLMPPISCLNDGIQIGSGATLGHGLITISDDTSKRVEAQFTCRDITITLTLCSACQEQIRSDIAFGVGQFGHSPAYWQYIRSLAIRYWSEWDRKAIFE